MKTLLTVWTLALILLSSGPARAGITTSPGSAIGTTVISTNLSIGEFWACDFGYSPTNTAAGNAAAMTNIINVVSNSGGGVIRIGGRFTNSVGQTINDGGEHSVPSLGTTPRISFKGDGAITIVSTLAHTVSGVFNGCFDWSGINLTGPGTNISDVYPYTNSVGLYEIGFYDPVVENCSITGFGQGAAMSQLGSYRGALYRGVHVVACDIGFAVGDQCDGLHLLQSDAREGLYGLDAACVVPTNNTGSYNGTNVARSSGAVVDGGIWDRDKIATFLIGKGGWHIMNGIGGSGRYRLLIGHPAWIPFAYANETSSQNIWVDNCDWSEDGGISTNIYVPGVGGSLGGNLKITTCGMIGDYGVVGPVVSLSYDGASFNVGTNFLPNGVGTVFKFNDAKLDYYGSANKTTEFFGEENGAYSNGDIIKRTDFHISTSVVNTPWSIGFVAGDRTDRARLELNALGGNAYALVFNAAGGNNMGIDLGAGSFASSSTNTLAVSSSGLTNNTTANYLISITAGTGLALKDGSGNGIIAPVLNETFPLKPGWRFTGTAVTGQAYQFP